ncbi:MAG TPA: glycosyl hydrolase [Polyangiaceae bacterium]|nr:glycosyl hydrolase [Polyangiaceae bacterium]
MATHCTKNLVTAGVLLAVASGCRDESTPQQSPSDDSEPPSSSDGRDAGPSGHATPEPDSSASAPPASGAGGAAPAPGSAAAGEAGSAAEPAPIPRISLSREAEEGQLNGLETASNRAGFSGSGYVTGFDNNDDELGFDVEVPAAGVYSLTLGYAADEGDRNTLPLVNDAQQAEIVLRLSPDFKETVPERVLLQQGTNHITLRSNWGYYDIDYLRVESWDDNRVFSPTNKLVTKNAAPEARALYRYLRRMYRTKTLSGQHYAYGVELDRRTPYDAGDHIFDVTGKWPAIAGFDFLFYTPIYGAGGDDSTEKAIEWYRDKHGIVTFCWHWFVPAGLSHRGFYSSETDFDVTRALTPGTEENTQILNDLDVIAAQLERLRDAGVPVLWRPLHEAEGGWFWWGAKGPEPAKALYRLMFERFTEEHGLDNLIWIWNSVSRDWYPGDDVVDIVSADLYLPQRSYATGASVFDSLNELVGGRRIVALSENSTIPDPDLMPELGAFWSWFMTWSGDFIETTDFTSKEQLRKVYQSDWVITLDELPRL